MREIITDSHFIHALTKGELAQFASGQGQYFVCEPDYGSHWVMASLKREILPLISMQQHELQQGVCLMIHKLIADSELDLNQKINLLLYHVYVHYYFHSEGKFKEDLLKSCEDEIVMFLKKAWVSINTSINPDVSGAIKQIQERGGLLTWTE